MLKLFFVLQFKVESDRHSICARSPPAFPGCLPLASVWPWGHYRPIYLLLPSLSSSTAVQVGTNGLDGRDVRDCKIIGCCSLRQSSCPNHSLLRQECRNGRRGSSRTRRRTRRRDTALVPSERGASKIVKAVYTKGRREKRGAP